MVRLSGILTKALKNDKRYIFMAAGAASKVHRYWMGKNPV
jgi:antirestriction protein ArdC